MEKEFNEIKNEIKEIKNLQIIDYNKRLVLRTDASNIGVGAVLMQENENGELKAIEWASKKLTPMESRYIITEKEMLGVLFGIEKFSYELKGRHFTVETDHKALLEIRKKPDFENSRVLRWIEKIMEYDFEVVYREGKLMGLADSLSKGKEECITKENQNKNNKKSGEAIKERRWNKHVRIVEGKEYWHFDNGEIREIPEIARRKDICIKFHINSGHKSALYTYYDVKKLYYWPGLKASIEKICKECDVCQVNNRKKQNPPEYVVTTRPMEKVAIDLLTLENRQGYIIIGIDYFTRMISTKYIKRKGAEEIDIAIREWFVTGYIPEELITDSGREFINIQFKEMCKQFGIKHHVVSVESHRSNGRIERVIGTIREMMRKNEREEINETLKYVTDVYNNSYHDAIKRSPNEAFEKYRDPELRKRNEENLKMKNKYTYKKVRIQEGQMVRVAQHDNLSKYENGRFLRLGKIVGLCENDSYVVQYEDTGKMAKKRLSDLKVVEASRLEGGC